MVKSKSYTKKRDNDFINKYYCKDQSNKFSELERKFLIYLKDIIFLFNNYIINHNQSDSKNLDDLYDKLKNDLSKYFSLSENINKENINNFLNELNKKIDKKKAITLVSNITDIDAVLQKLNDINDNKAELLNNSDEIV